MSELLNALDPEWPDIQNEKSFGSRVYFHKRFTIRVKQGTGYTPTRHAVWDEQTTPPEAYDVEFFNEGDTVSKPFLIEGKQYQSTHSHDYREIIAYEGGLPVAVKKIE